MSRYVFVVLAVLCSVSPLNAQSEIPEGWSVGPTVGKLGNRASVSIPDDYMFLDAKATKLFLEQNQNIPDGDELGAILKVGENNEYWFAVFSYDDTGHVDDSDRSKIDADGLMKSMKKGNEQGNAERRKRGWNELKLTGWHQPPFYDPATNNLTWATRLDSSGNPVINHSVRLLGRTGTMSVALVADPTGIDAATAEFNDVLRGYSYNDGQRYAQFVSGDKLAGYGLTALIAGGAGAAAMKSGLLQKMWKGIVLLVVAIGAALKKMLAALFGKRPDESGPRPVPVPPAPAN